MLENGEFPKSPCYVCGRKIENLNGFIAFDNFAKRQIPSLLERFEMDREELLKSQYGDFVNVVTAHYFGQFKEHFNPMLKGRAIDLGEFARNIKIDANAHIYRINKVLENPPEEFLVLILHDNCYPFTSGPAYPIKLERIDNLRKAWDWTFHLNEKTWLNREAWIDTVEALFGRKGV